MSNSGDARDVRSIIFGSRRSKLAIWQTHTVRDRVCALDKALEWKVETFVTAGDKNISQPLPQIGGKGLFTQELNQAIRQHKIDIAVHSLKDLPTVAEKGIKVIPVLPRENPGDVLVSRNGQTLAELPLGSIVGTSSPRRRSQLLAARPDLEVRSIRGNVPTRIQKVKNSSSDRGSSDYYDATILAAAGVIRLELTEAISEHLPLEQFLPAPGQGCVAATCRADDHATIQLFEGIADHETNQCVLAERQLLHHLGGGCSAPIAAHGQWVDGKLKLTGRIGSLDGSHVVTQTLEGTDPDSLAKQLAENLRSGGGESILHEVFPLQNKRIAITRSAKQNHPLRQIIQAKGAVPVEIPLIQFESIETDTGQLNRLFESDRILFTSANAARFFNQLYTEPQIIELAPKMNFLGPKTAEAMTCMWPDITWPDNFKFARAYTGVEFANSIDVKPGEKIILPCAETHSSETLNRLKEKGAEAVAWPIYRTLFTPLSAESKAHLATGLDVILFASPSAINSFCDQVKDYQSVLKSTLVACIGTTTRDCATQKGISVQVMPEKYSTIDLVEALCEYVRQNEGKSL